VEERAIERESGGRPQSFADPDGDQPVNVDTPGIPRRSPVEGGARRRGVWWEHEHLANRAVNNSTSRRTRRPSTRPALTEATARCVAGGFGEQGGQARDARLR